MNPGLRSCVATAGGWLMIAGCALATVLFYDELKATMATVLGLEIPVEAAAATLTVADEAPPAASGTVVEIRAGRGGHFTTTAEINGSPVDVLVDTGASVVALTWDDAVRAGLQVGQRDFTGRVMTANGPAAVAPVTIDRVSIGDITVHNVPASVSEPGKLTTTLLGMAFLTRLGRSEIRSGTLVLEQ